MNPRLASALGLAFGWSLAGCAPIDDEVFVPEVIDHGDEPVLLNEDAGAVEIPVRLAAPPSGEVSARYRFEELEAQATCQSPDFLAPSGRVT